MKKSKWEKPKLIILVRSKPEESVLLGCKVPGGGLQDNSASSCTDEVSLSCFPCKDPLVS